MGKRSDRLREIDRAIGRNIRLQRRTREVSQVVQAEAIGVSAQQLQKYESGVDRVSASRILIISLALDAPISVFFEGTFYQHAERP